jgi:4-hydroxythreonine-4-phosphate dehydrogenase
MTSKPPRIGLFIGDMTGIGPEITAKVVAQRAGLPPCFLLGVGDHRAFQLGQRLARIKLEYPVYEDIADVDASKGTFAFIDLKNLDPSGVPLGHVSPRSGKAVGDTLTQLVQWTLSHYLDAVVYAPLSKEALYRGGYPFKGEIGLFAQLLGVKDGFGEMNVLGDLWTSRVTSHISLADVSKLITRPKVVGAITLADATLQRAHIAHPKIGVSALNPHGGEGGLFGREEPDIIGPAVQDAKALGINVVGPYSADTIFLRVAKEQLNAIVSMYHDQSQIAMKLMGFDRGVTVNAGLPLILTTPSHGTAFDIVGHGVANPNALKEALVLAAKMAS